MHARHSSHKLVCMQLARRRRVVCVCVCVGKGVGGRGHLRVHGAGQCFKSQGVNDIPGWETTLQLSRKPPNHGQLNSRTVNGGSCCPHWARTSMTTAKWTLAACCAVLFKPMYRTFPKAKDRKTPMRCFTAVCSRILRISVWPAALLECTSARF